MIGKLIHCTCRYIRLVSRSINDWRDHGRISEEVEKLVADIIKEEEEVRTFQATQDEDQENVDSLKEQQTDLQQMYELARRLRDEVGMCIVIFELKYIICIWYIIHIHLLFSS